MVSARRFARFRELLKIDTDGRHLAYLDEVVFSILRIVIKDPRNTYAKYPFHPGHAAVGGVERPRRRGGRFGVGRTVYHAGPHPSHAVVDPVSAAVLPVPDDIPELAALALRSEVRSGP